MKIAQIVFVLLMAYPAIVLSSDMLDTIDVSGTRPETDRVKAESVSLSKVSSDTATMLGTIPGVSFQTGGGLSSLPVIHGMADDRVNIQIDGASITSSCSNHMNPALSYIDPSKVSVMDVWAGLTPVRHGGDSIAGSIIVKTKDLIFADSSQKIRQNLNSRTYFKSNNENLGSSLSYSVATDKFFFGYSGFDERANNYRDGHGRRIRSTLYTQNNQTATIGRRFVDGALSFKMTRSVIPYQGFVNQYMDLKDNTSNLYNLSYTGSAGEVAIESSLFYQHTNHLMDNLSAQRAGSMPMHTRSDESGYNFKASIPIDQSHLVTVGSDYRNYRLNDWWPPISGVTSIMGPETFESIKNGKRNRLGLFIEADSEWSSFLTTNMGIRTDIVSMDTGDVQGYNSTDNLPTDALYFNGRSRFKRDHNYDATFLTKFKTSQRFDVEFGIARKTRSPNLYERYAWAGSVTNPTASSNPASNGASMDMLMINWFGDGNGYVGDVNLKPEVAHKMSTSFIFHDEQNKKYEMKFTPYVSEIKNFIDADYIGTSRGHNFLRFANHDAIIFGGDFSSRHKIMMKPSWGEFQLKTVMSYTRGYRRDGKADLYHLMPLNGKLIFEHSLGKWSYDFVVHLVAKKEQVNELRLEPMTGSYALLDFGTSYQLTRLIKIDLGINNIFNLTYGLPLGGIDLVNHSPASRMSVVGIGRSINTALSMDFF